MHAMTGDSNEVTIERIHCNKRRQKTRHELLCKAVDVVSEEYEECGPIEFTTTFETFRCCGCREAVLRRTTTRDADPECKRPILLGTMQYMAPELLTLLP